MIGAAGSAVAPLVPPPNARDRDDDPLEAVPVTGPTEEDDPMLTDDVVAQADLRKTLELILADVASWDQTAWGVRVPLADRPTECRTAFCVAGHYVVNVAGYRAYWSQTTGRASDWYPDGSPDHPTQQLGAVRVPTTYDPTRTVLALVEDVAAAGFGLYPDQADELFAERNSLRRVLDLAYRYSGGAVDLYDRYAEVVAADPALADRERATERLAAERDERLVRAGLVRGPGCPS